MKLIQFQAPYPSIFGKKRDLPLRVLWRSWSKLHLKEQGKNPFILDSKAPTRPLREFLENENRFASLKRAQPQDAEILFAQAEKDCAERFAYLQRLAQWQE